MTTGQRTCVGCFAVWMFMVCFWVFVHFLTVAPKQSATVIKGDWNKMPSPEMTRARKLNYADVVCAIAPEPGLQGAEQKTVTDYMGQPDSTYFENTNTYCAVYRLWDARIIVRYGWDDRVSSVRKIN